MDSDSVATLMLRRAGPAALAVLLVVAGASCNRQGASEAPRLTPYLGKYLGDATAPIVVEAMLPVNNGCQDALGLYLAQVAVTHPELLRVRILDMKGQEGRAVMAAHGIRCAAVLVQGTTRFDLGGDAGKVLLEGPMDPLDVYRVLQHHVGTTAASQVELPVPVDCAAPSPDERRKAGF